MNTVEKILLETLWTAVALTFTSAVIFLAMIQRTKPPAIITGLLIFVITVLAAGLLAVAILVKNHQTSF